MNVRQNVQQRPVHAAPLGVCAYLLQCFGSKYIVHYDLQPKTLNLVPTELVKMRAGGSTGSDLRRSPPARIVQPPVNLRRGRLRHAEPVITGNTGPVDLGLDEPAKPRLLDQPQAARVLAAPVRFNLRPSGLVRLARARAAHDAERQSPHTPAACPHPAPCS